MIVLIKIFDEKFIAIKSDVRLMRYCNLKKTVNLIQTDINQFSMIKFSEKRLSKSIISKNFQKKSKKMLKKISKKCFFRKKSTKT